MGSTLRDSEATAKADCSTFFWGGGELPQFALPNRLKGSVICDRLVFLIKKKKKGQELSTEHRNVQNTPADSKLGHTALVQEVHENDMCSVFITSTIIRE